MIAARLYEIELDGSKEVFHVVVPLSEDADEHKAWREESHPAIMLVREQIAETWLRHRVLKRSDRGPVVYVHPSALS